MPQKPTVGRIVHYVARGSADGVYPPKCRAAIVADVDEYQPSADGEFVGHLDLAVVNPEGLHFNKGCLEDQGKPVDEPTSLCTGLHHAGGTWHWPARS